MKSPREENPPRGERSEAPFPTRLQRAGARVSRLRVRDWWWRWLDHWESSPTFRRWHWLVLGIGLLGAALVFGVYPWWNRRNAVKLARQWLAAGRVNYAVESVQDAMRLDPQNPEPWQIAAEIARRRGQPDRAADYARHAAELAPADAALQVAWAAEVLRADRATEAEAILAKTPPAYVAASADAQRLWGELARRKREWDKALAHFEAARKIDGSTAVNEVPIGLILLQARDLAERQRGLDLLIPWVRDVDWGATAARTLLDDASRRNDLPAMAQWADALRTHPACTVGDMPVCLLALSRAAPAQFKVVLERLERDHAVSPAAATQLLSWLNQIGRSAEALAWMKTLPAEHRSVPPLAVAAAEAWRLSGDWAALKAATTTQAWGADTEFLRWAYGMQAAQQTGDNATAAEFWRTLKSHAQVNGAHALFAGSTIFSWGLVDKAEALWWEAASQEGKIATDALGTLARFYQSRRDAEGQYRVFRQLHLLQPQDAATANNYSFFAALTGREQRLAEQAARANVNAAPGNPTFVATLAFNLVMQQRGAEALTVLKPVESLVKRDAAVQFVSGVALASVGKKSEAEPLLRTLAPATLTELEVALIERLLTN